MDGNEPEPDNGKDAAGQDNEVAEVVSKRHASKNGKRSVKRSTHSAVNGDHETHDEVAEDAGAYGRSPAEADGNHGRSDFPVRDGPGIGHPIGDIGLPGPCALGRGDRVEVGVGSIFGGREAALLLVDCETEAGETPFEAGCVTDLDVRSDR